MGIDPRLSRSDFLRSLSAAALMAGTTIDPARALAQETPTAPDWSAEDLAIAERFAGLTLTEEQRENLVEGIQRTRQTLNERRAEDFPNSLSPQFVFTPHTDQPIPLMGAMTVPMGTAPDTTQYEYLSIVELNSMLMAGKVTSRQLTEYFLNRLKMYGPRLRCVINLTEERALAAADRADEMIRTRQGLSFLTGIPCGVKDLFAMKGTPTTWGAAPFKDQMIDDDADIVQRLENAGAVICAKLSMGALAYGDLWFGGLTLNPWNPRQGSSGSSAGSAAAVSAGLVPFAIGTETLGSIVSPSHRCRTVGLRPTFGIVSRAGAMALSWTMDKIGPICNSVDDAVIVLSVLVGTGRELTVEPYSLTYKRESNLRGMKIAVTKPGSIGDREDEATMNRVVGILRGAGATVDEREFTPAPNGLTEVLSIEAAAAFDDLTRSGRVDEMEGSLWPPIFRSSMFPTGVDYVQLMRARHRYSMAFHEEFGDYDAIIAPERAGQLLVTTNLTGHPQIFLPLGNNAAGSPVGVSVIGRLYNEGTMANVAWVIEDRMPPRTTRPDLNAIPVPGDDAPEETLTH